LTTTLSFKEETVNQVLKKAAECAWTIIKLVIPFSLVCDFLNYFGVIENTAFLFSPIGNALLLPSGIAIALASGFFFNLYAGIAVAATLDLTSSQWTIFGIFLATCHSMPIEGAVLKKVGMPLTWHWLTRIACGFTGAWLFSKLFINTDRVLSQFPHQDKGGGLTQNADMTFFSFLLDSLSNSCLLAAKVIALVVGLIVFFELLKSIKIVARFLNTHAYFSSLIVGGLLGVTYGAGILLKEIKNVNKFERVLLLVFLMLAHGLIEETLLFTFFGASPLPILSFRIGFGLYSVLLTYLFMKSTSTENENLVVRK
jgi:hypothetical protein